ncbi:MAG: hypothetical protein RIS64_4335, partial [Bacteroidota bacterium]
MKEVILDTDTLSFISNDTRMLYPILT